jgi:hypothetical protein
MVNKTGKVKVYWFWGFVRLCGIFGYILKEPLYYVFSVFFLFFLEPVLRKPKK